MDAYWKTFLSKIKSNFKRVDNNGLTKLYLDNLSLVFKDNKLVEISVIENKDVDCITMNTIYSATQI